MKRTQQQQRLSTSRIPAADSEQSAPQRELMLAQLWGALMEQQITPVPSKHKASSKRNRT